MNKCKNYKIPCPFALVTWSELPCFGTQEQCDSWLARVKRECPELWFRARKEHRDWLAGVRFQAKSDKIPIK